MKRKLSESKEERKSQVIAKWVVYNKEPKNTSDMPTPILTFGIFSTVMRELGVQIFAGKGEADRATVAIANYYGYPVLANDSDYYMYDIKAGYIPFHRFKWRTIPLKVEVYKLREFNYQFGITNAKLSRVIPAVLGNDLIKLGLLNELIELRVVSSQNYQQVESLVEYISTMENVEQLIYRIGEKGHKGEEIAKTLKKHIKKQRKFMMVLSH